MAFDTPPVIHFHVVHNLHCNGFRVRLSRAAPLPRRPGSLDGEYDDDNADYVMWCFSSRSTFPRTKQAGQESYTIREQGLGETTLRKRQ